MGRSRGRRGAAPAIGLAAVMVLGGFAAPVVGPAQAADGVVFTAAGDIDGCASAGKDTADLVKRTAGPVATLGDNAYPDGSAGDYARCYDPTWGAFKDRTHPVAGNHDYDASKATPYYQYFGAAAGQPGTGWYSYDAGTWHVVALNSNCGDVDCSKQAAWLDTDLAAHPAACILAYWHHPRFSSGTSGGDSDVAAFWKVLYAHGATLVLNGHDHDYERFAPQDPSGHLDQAKGIREFIVGTGGGSLGSLAGSAANSEVRNNRTYGVLELTLREGSYSWRFAPAEGDKFTDQGTGNCQGTAPAAAPAPDPAPAPAPASDPASDPAPDSPPPAAAEPAGPPAGPTPDSPPATDPWAAPPTTSSSHPDAPAGGPAPTKGGGSRPAAPPSPAARPAAPRGAAAGSSGRAGSAPPASATTTAALPPLSPIVDTSPALAAPVTPPAEPAAPAAPGPSPPAGDEAALPAEGRLPVTIAGLIQREAPRGRTDHRGAALLAVFLICADGLAMAALRPRRS